MTVSSSRLSSVAADIVISVVVSVVVVVEDCAVGKGDGNAEAKNSAVVEVFGVEFRSEKRFGSS